VPISRIARNLRLPLLGAVLLLLAPALASAAATTVVTVGPLAAGDGYYATVLDVGCGTRANHLSVRYTTGRAGVGGLAHVYAGPAAAACRLPSGRRPGTLRAVWPGVARLALRLTQTHGSASGELPLGCAGSVRASHDALATGVLRLAIHPSVFGRISQSVSPAGMQTVGALSCGQIATPAAGTVTLVATTARQLLVTEETPHNGSVLAMIDYAPDVPSPGVSGQLIAALQGDSSVFDAGPFLASARIGGIAPFSSGSLWFTALPPCPGFPGALNGILTGALTFQDPVLGPVTVAGSQARSVSIARAPAGRGPVTGSGSRSEAPARRYSPSSAPASASMTTCTCSSNGTPRASAPASNSSRPTAAANPRSFIFFLTDFGVMPASRSGRT
jgi:hypothetical protein